MHMDEFIWCYLGGVGELVSLRRPRPAIRSGEHCTNEYFVWDPQSGRTT